MTNIDKMIIILSTQRGGSTMVCDDFAGTDKLGRPSEYFIKLIDIMNRGEKLNLEYINDFLFQKASTDNGVTSIKIMSNQLKSIDRLYKSVGVIPQDTELRYPYFYEIFQNSLFIKLTRKDKVSQAVSRIMARKTNIYHSVETLNGLDGMLGKVIQDQERDENFKFSFSEVQDTIKNIQQEEKNLNLFIKTHNINAVDINYEDIVDNRKYIYDISHRIDIEDIILLNRRLKKISGEKSLEWVKLYNQKTEL